MSTRFAYSVLVRGTGLHRVIEGVDCAVGFYTTVFVTAKDEQEARVDAVDRLRARLEANQAITDRTSLQVEEARRIRAEEVPDIQPGLAFYRE